LLPGTALQALSLPLSGARHASISGIEAGLAGIYGNQSADLSTLGGISNAINA
jgi:hypothetical protein